MLLEDFDETKNSTFDPEEVHSVVPGFPKIGITCFSRRLFDKIVENLEVEEIATTKNGNGREPIYKTNYKGVDIAIFMSRLGAPACVMAYEEILAMGLEKLVMFGTCGVLDSRIDDLSIIIPTSAYRDEGTSYHYAPTSDEISVNEKYVDEFIEILNEKGCSYTKGKVWTIDAPYRETRAKVQKRKEQGCICVDMECSAMSAVSKFRNKEFFQFFYAADNLDAEKWDKRSLDNQAKLEDKERIAYLALELAIKMK